MTYDEIASIYDRAYSGGEFVREDRLVARALRRFVPRNSRVLDVGCGTGKGIELLPGNVDYVGVDLSAAMLEVARTNFPTKRFVLGDARGLPFSDKTFDVVVSTYGSLSHVLEIEVALAEIARVLRPNGRAFMMFYGLDNRRYPQRRDTVPVWYSPRGVDIPADFRVPARLYSTRSIRKLLSLKFRHVRVRGLTQITGRESSAPKVWSGLDSILDRMLCSVFRDASNTLCVQMARRPN